MILLTGATGFVGSALLKHFDTGDVTVLGRNCPNHFPEKNFKRFDLAKDSLEDLDLAGVDCLIHCAARAHVMKETLSDPLDEYRRVNTYATEKLAKKAIEQGVKKFIFLSSIKVNGENTNLKPFSAFDEPAPKDHYGQSKFEAESRLLSLGKNSKLEIAILRLPLIYGPGVKGNFLSLIRLCLGTSLNPFAGIKSNRRSLLYIENLVGFVVNLVYSVNNIGGVYLVSDLEPVSTSKMLDFIYKGLKISPIKIIIPSSFLLMIGKMLGKQRIINRLTSSLEVNFQELLERTNWKPLYTTEEGLVRTASFYGFGRKNNSRLIRLLDIIFSLIGFTLLLPIMLVVYVCGYFDTKSPLFYQERVGKNLKPFTLIKFRTMKINTKSVASHLASSNSITKLGKFLRKSKLDELPQLVNVLKGEMSLVGPRPNLFNQKELIEERGNLRIYDVRPGITGLAQLSNIDMSNPKLLAKADAKMIDSFNLNAYFSYLFKTALGRGSGDRVSS